MAWKITGLLLKSMSVYIHIYIRMCIWLLYVTHGKHIYEHTSVCILIVIQTIYAPMLIYLFTYLLKYVSIFHATPRRVYFATGIFDLFSLHGMYNIVCWSTYA